LKQKTFSIALATVVAIVVYAWATAISASPVRELSRLSAALGFFIFLFTVCAQRPDKAD
jgi:hypothetical protein